MKLYSKGFSGMKNLAVKGKVKRQTAKAKAIQQRQYERQRRF
jgi:hypothetical protein